LYAQADRVNALAFSLLNVSYKTMPRNLRRTAGNTLVIVLITLCFVIIPILIMVGQSGFKLIDFQRIQNTMDAACLLAANDASRITINDQNFGYVSLSNYPPVGKATLAQDGEPLPVIGINSLIGTIRQNSIVARELGNSKMISLVDADRLCLDKTMSDLNETLKDAVSLKSKEKYYDIHGVIVEPVKDVTALLKSSLPPNIKLESIRLSTGWLSGGGRTNIVIPQPVGLSQTKPDEVQSNTYKAFVDIPVDGRRFTFAGLDSTSCIVSPRAFRDADSKHMCSIIKVECVFAVQNLGGVTTSKFSCQSCGEPFSMPEVGPAGIMTLRFSGVPTAGLRSWSDFLKENNFRDVQVSKFDAVDGDYPLDRHSRLHQYRAESDSGTSAVFAEHLYCWLRNGHLRPRIDSVLSMVTEPFLSTTNGLYVYEFTKSGTINRRMLRKDPFPVGVTSDSQCSVIANTAVQGGSTPTIVFRNDVKNLGSKLGGKHGGQPLAGDPLDWCELADYGGDAIIARDMSKGRLGTRLTLVDPANPVYPIDPGRRVNLDVFRTYDGKVLSSQPRKNYYSGGLAMDIEIGGLRPSTASIDVARMRHLPFARKI
jgi:hypothetical protein